MKGRSSNICRANGGSVMRDIGGIKAPSYGTDSAVMKAAEGKTTGIVDMDGPSGGPAKPRLDRPGRKHGGSVCKADGGSVSSGKRTSSMEEYGSDNPRTVSERARDLGRLLKGKPVGSATQSEPSSPTDNRRMDNWYTGLPKKSGGKVDFKKHGKY